MDYKMEDDTCMCNNKTYDVDVAVDYIMNYESAILMPKYDGLYAEITFGWLGEIEQVLTKDKKDITQWFNRCASYRGFPAATIHVELLPEDCRLKKADLEKALSEGDIIDIVAYSHLDVELNRVVYSNSGREMVKNSLLHFNSLEKRIDGVAIYVYCKPFYFLF